MLGFLEPGLQLGIDHAQNRNREAEPYFMLTVINNSSYQIAVESRQLSLDELREKYLAIDQYAKKTLSNYKKDLQERSKELDAGKQYAKPTLSMAVNHGTLFCTIVSVGDDYVLVSYGESRERKRLIPKHMIRQIDWDEGLAKLFSHANIVDADETVIG